jgi:hypothetical protein
VVKCTQVRDDTPDAAVCHPSDKLAGVLPPGTGRLVVRYRCFSEVMEWDRPAGRILLLVAAQIFWCSDSSVITGNPPAVLAMKRAVVGGGLRRCTGAFIAR